MLLVAACASLFMNTSAAVGSAPLADESTEELAKRVEELEQRVRDLESVIEELRRQSSKPTATPPGQNFGKSSKGGAAKVLPSGSVVIKVTSFVPASANAAVLAEAAKLEAGLAADDAEVKRLEEQKRKLYDAFKELEQRYRTGREMSDVEYKRIMDENKNQRDDIVKVIARIQKKQNVNRRKAAAIRHDADAAGQRIEGEDPKGNLVVVTTKYDCSKVLAADVRVVLVNPKSVNASGGFIEYTADRVELAP